MNYSLLRYNCIRELQLIEVLLYYHILLHGYNYGTLNSLYWNVHIYVVICTACFTYVTHEHVLLNVNKVFLSFFLSFFIYTLE